MTGGRRGRCAGAEYYEPLSQAFGVGRGGRPWGGGRGRAWGGGRGWGWEYREVPPAAASYPVPDAPAAGIVATVSGILDRLNRLADTVADLHERFTATDSGRQEPGDESRS
jgi:hypothetical protein